MSIATYTRSLIRAAVKLHAASLRRVEAAADAAAERAFKRAEQMACDCEYAEEQLRAMKEDAAAAYGRAHVEDQKAQAISEAITDELSRLGKL